MYDVCARGCRFVQVFMCVCVKIQMSRCFVVVVVADVSKECAMYVKRHGLHNQ